MESNFNLKEFIKDATSKGICSDLGMQFLSVKDQEDFDFALRCSPGVPNLIGLSELASEEADLKDNKVYISLTIFISLGSKFGLESMRKVFEHLVKALKESHDEIESSGLQLPSSILFRRISSPKRSILLGKFILIFRGDADFGEGSPDLWDNSASSGSQGPEEIEGYEYFMVKK